MPVNNGSVAPVTPHEWIGHSATWSRPLILELVGPAGAGKTSVLRAIGQRDPHILAGLRIDRLRFAARMGRHAVGLAPTIAELVWRGVPSRRLAAVHLLRLRTLPAVLQRQAHSPLRAIVLDEGPVFSLSRLCVFQDADRAGGRLGAEWQAARQRALGYLDGVVWLDTSDSVLLHRIREREKEVIRGGTEAQVARLLVRYRDVYRRLLEGVRSAGRATILEVDTATQSADAVADRILAALPPWRALSSTDRGH